ncbi:phage holin family protein [Rubellicoccus peritrichatus]|uniref:Phage holin family protein n=1 Tax=Rubellicoccus peritrichatus TaxID=3080537 RepID=A0AAQ3LCH1_9BACT|nr:phage holin family protein [Puniceicoccus sp. CR14]WOO42837.1 phage holin family protein [Puniceicoccus sp. CR14]
MQNINWPKVFKSWALIALGVLVAAWTSSGIHYEGWGSLLFAVVLISFFNVILRPILVLLALPFVILTLGLGIFLINALLFLLVGELVPGFEVASFGSALWGSIVVGVVSLVANLIFGTSRVEMRVNRNHGGPQGGLGKRRVPKDDDVIDI